MSKNRMNNENQCWNTLSIKWEWNSINNENVSFICWKFILTPWSRVLKRAWMALILWLKKIKHCMRTLKFSHDGRQTYVDSAMRVWQYQTKLICGTEKRIWTNCGQLSANSPHARFSPQTYHFSSRIKVSCQIS